ncbi:CHAP domain-containing protein [Dongia sp.]|uniref:CHAP domain-containing protein n=1 Tax=Dongia sp. TaxID=1977262 RepID=UPI0035ADB7D7
MTSLTVLLLLTACADSDTPFVAPRSASLTPSGAAPGSGLTATYDDMQCVPYARLASGINLRGDAYTWWDGAAGIYRRGAAPTPGAVLVLARTSRLRSGHVAVVRQVISSREILVDHANWIPGQVLNGQSVHDVSPANDWTMPRFYNFEAGVYGSVYPAYGFIYNVAATTAPAPVASSGTLLGLPPQ